MISGSAILDTARPRDPENMISWKISHLGAGPVPLMELVTLGGGEFPSKSILGNSAHRAGIPSLPGGDSEAPLPKPPGNAL
jgi:hypothetical protein